MGTEKPLVLVVDDDDDARNIAKRYVEEIYGHRFVSASTYDGGLRVIESTRENTVAFIDIHLSSKPGKSGLDFLRYIQENASHRVLAYGYTGEDSLMVEAKALEEGAVHVFHKSVDKWDRLILYAETSVVARMLRQSGEDFLTGLYTYNSFRKRVLDEMRTARSRDDKRKPSCYSLLFLDLDRFKSINDTYGHAVGDIAIQMVAATLKSHVRPTDYVCRKGGDEFLIWLPKMTEVGATQVGNKIQELVSLIQVPAKDELVPLAISVGVSSIKGNEIVDVEEDFQSLFDKANVKEIQNKNRESEHHTGRS